ncbi:MAG: hypothetical protein LBN02_03465 [Oscillospiraceae bacterium]|jgi:hypothetical protein|nr:hypothetical protein [Oscillospiraceae bacterium]
MEIESKRLHGGELMSHKIVSVGEDEVLGRLLPELQKRYDGFNWEMELTCHEVEKFDIDPAAIARTTGIAADLIAECLHTGELPMRQGRERTDQLSTVLSSLSVEIAAATTDPDTLLRVRIDGFDGLTQQSGITRETIAKYANVGLAELSAFLDDDADSLSDADKCRLAIAVLMLQRTMEYQVLPLAPLQEDYATA